MRKKISIILTALCLGALLAACAQGEAVPPEAPAPEEVPPAAAPEETVPEEEHAPAAQASTVADPVSGYCGNTVTTVTRDGSSWSFWGDDSVALTDLLINTEYADGLCRCPVEVTVDTEFGGGYGVNLSEGYARYDGGQTALTEEQLELIRGIIERQSETAEN